jgi:hypothetical protein
MEEDLNGEKSFFDLFTWKKTIPKVFISPPVNPFSNGRRGDCRWS